MPPMISVIARNSEGSRGSFSITVALMIPSSGIASRHSEVVTAGRLRFTIVIAQLANAVQTIPSVLGGGLFGIPSYWNGNVYFSPVNAKMKAFSITGAHLSNSFTSQAPR